MKGKKKIIIPAVVVVLVVLLVLIYLFQTGAFKTKLQKFEEQSNIISIPDTWEYYEDEIQGTRYEDQGRKIMLNALEEVEERNEFGVLITQYADYLDDFVKFLQQFQEDDPLYDRANAAHTTYQGMLDLSSHLTDPFDIYANKESVQSGKSVTLVGWIESNDVQRRMLSIDLGNYQHFEINYSRVGLLSDFFHEKSLDEWLDFEGGYIVAIGQVKRYNNSMGTYLEALRISELSDCDWETISGYF